MRAISSRTRSGETPWINGASRRMAAKLSGFDLKPQPRGEPNRAQQAKVILAEAAFRVAYRANQPGVEIRTSTDEIEYLAVRGIQQERVDRKIPAQHVLPRIGFKLDPNGMPAIGIFKIAAKSGDLHLIALLADKHHPKMSAHPIRPREKPKQFIGLRGSRNVEILGSAPQQQVADAASCQVRLMAISVNTINDLAS